MGINNILVWYAEKIHFTNIYSNNVKQINKYKGAYTNQSLYKRYNNGQNIFNKYCEWRCGRVNCDVIMFEHHIKAEYRNFIKNSKIMIDYADVLDLKNENIVKKIEELSLSIGTFKQSSYESSDQIANWCRKYFICSK